MRFRYLIAPCGMLLACFVVSSLAQAMSHQALNDLRYLQAVGLGNRPQLGTVCEKLRKSAFQSDFLCVSMKFSRVLSTLRRGM